MLTKKLLLTCLACIFVLAVFTSNSHAWEGPIVVDNENNHSFHKPEIHFGSSGAAYITYRKKNNASRNSDIILATYDGKQFVYENVSELGKKWNTFKAYESDIAIDTDENIHVAWAGLSRANTSTQHIMYRVKKDNAWSDVYDLGSLDVRSDDYLFDLRLAVGPNGNVHIALMKHERRNTWYVAKYGDSITPIQKVGNSNKYVKHPDIAVDENFVHLIWQEKIGDPYAIFHQKIENKPGGQWFPKIQITNPKMPSANQKSRIVLDQYNLAHFAIFYKTGDHKKLNYWVENAGGSYSKIKNLSDPSKIQLYHFAGLALKGNSVIASMQLGDDLGGRGIWYNWKQNGVWSDYTRLPGSEGAAHQSIDLSEDGSIAAIAFARRDSEIVLASSAPITATGILEAEFSHPANLFAASEITFDASMCAGINPDFNIALYTWDFGDGMIETSTFPTISHTYNVYGFPVEVVLSITADSGETGVAKKEFHLHALYNAIVTSVTPKNIRSLFFNRPAYEISWKPNPKNTDAGYPSISKYEIWRAPSGSFAGSGQFIKVAEVNAGAELRYFDWRGLERDTNYVYEIRCVDSEGHISPIGNY